MNLAYLSQVSTYSPFSSRAHAYQITSRLSKKGVNIVTLRHDENPNFAKVERNRDDIIKTLEKCDAIYVRADISLEEFLLPILRNIKKTVFWEVNSSTEEILWIIKLSRKRFLSRYYFKESLKERIRLLKKNAIRKEFARYVDLAFCISEPLEQYVRDVYGVARTALVPNGSDPELFKPNHRDRSVFRADPDDILIVWAGSFEYPWHDKQRILKVVREAKTSFPKWKFIFLAYPELLPPDLPDNVIFKKIVPYQGLSRYLASCDIGFLLYRGIHFQRLGNYFSPLKLYDYLACGLPVVVSDSGPQSGGVVKKFNCGILVDDSYESIINAIIQLAEAPEKRKQLGENGRRAIESYYNWERAASNTFDAMCSLIDRPLKLRRSS